MAERESGRPESDATIALLSVTLDRLSGQPLVRQLYAHLRELILTRRIAPGARLPSTRKLSRELDVSRTVTLEAFGQLAAEGFLETRLGSGHYVAHLRLPEAGATAVIQPGGSVRDDEVIKAADEKGLAMVFTGIRHFRH